MDFWTQLKKSGQDAAGKAKDLAESTKLQLEQKESERKLEKLYTQLGKAYYEKAMDDEENEFADIIQPINQLNAEIEASKKQQALLKNGARCVACGALVDQDASFCTSCGADLTKKEPETPAQTDDGKITCPGCGRSVDPTAFCIYCGTKLS